MAANDTDRPPPVISFPLPRNFPRGRVIVPEPCHKEEKERMKERKKEQDRGEI